MDEKQTFYERFTKPEDALKYIQELNSIDLNNITEDELNNIIDDKFPIIPIHSAKIRAGTRLYRARVNKGDEAFDKVKDIFIPPVHKIDKYGRANSPQDQIFYCSANIELAVFEVLQNLKYSLSPKMEVAFLTIGIWETLEELHVANIINSPILHTLRPDLLTHYEEVKKIIDKNNLPQDVITSDNLIGQFFTEQFIKSDIKSENDYKFSVLFVKKIRQMNEVIAEHYKADKFDGINYPSVAMKYKGDNQALFLETATNKIKLVNTLHITASNFDFENGTFVHGVIHEAESINNGDVLWKKEIYKPS
jgi:hypothetical protein